MNRYFELPSGYIIRKARSKDKWEVISLCCDDFQVLVLGCILIFLVCVVILPTLLVNENVPIILIYIFFGLLTISQIFVYSLMSQNFESSQYWLIEYERKIIGCAVVKQYAQYCELTKLYLKSNYRNQGLGSCLVQAFLREIAVPVYVISAPKALYFYIRNGFKPIPRNKLPQVYRILSRQGNLVLGFTSGDFGF